MKNILEMLENSTKLCPDKTAFKDNEKAITYKELLNNSKKIGTALGSLKCQNKPIAIYLDKSVATTEAMMGVIYSGNFYTIIDCEMPIERIKKIFETLKPVAIISEKKYLQNTLQLGTENIFTIEVLKRYEVNEKLLKSVRDLQIDTDPLYTLYTSGSTGTPKGTVITHKNVLAYSEWVTQTFNINSNSIIGNQTPFYFSMSVTDIYSTVLSGATMIIIPKIYFSFPVKLIEYLNESKVNTIYWVPSAYGIISNSKAFEVVKLKYLKTAMFAGEVMPIKYLNYWIDNLPDNITYANLYGPTETTDICTYYVVERKFNDNESLPIGKHCDNCNVFAINDKNKLADINEEGELYVRGSFLAQGYYNDTANTQKAFVQNPLNNTYPETCYKTGDLVKLNENKELIYICRKDYQIKHMGYRIELGEIEAAALSINKISECAAIYDEQSDKIILYYSGQIKDKNIIFNDLKDKLTSYMMPNKLIKLSALPHNQNGKIDRKTLKQNYDKKG